MVKHSNEADGPMSSSSSRPWWPAPPSPSLLPLSSSAKAQSRLVPACWSSVKLELETIIIICLWQLVKPIHSYSQENYSLSPWLTHSAKEAISSLILCLGVLSFKKTNNQQKQINKCFPVNVHQYCLGTSPFLFWGAWLTFGVLPPSCDWQPCTSARPLQVFSYFWFFSFILFNFYWPLLPASF